jgi:hypothetical protein
MIEPEGTSGTVDPPKRRWKLWHLTAAVLASALVFAAIRTLGDESYRPWVLVILASILGSAFVGSVSLAGKLGGRATLGLRNWGLRRGGVVGFCAWVLGLGVNVLFIVAAILGLPVALISGFFWIVRAAGL